MLYRGSDSGAANGRRGGWGGWKRRGRRKLLPLVWLALGCAGPGALCPSPLAAQSEPANAADEGEFKAVLKKALEAYERGDYPEARRLFEQAHAIEPSARTLRAIGLTALKEQRYAAAAVTLQAALDSDVKPLTPEQEREVRDALEEAEAFVAEVQLDVTPEGAEIEVDGEPAVIVDGVLWLDPGERDLVVSAPGYSAARLRVAAEARQQLSLSIHLDPLTPELLGAAGVTRRGSTAKDPSEASHAGRGLSSLQWTGVGVGAAGVIGLGVSVYFGVRAKTEYDDSGCAAGGCPDAAAKRLNDSAIESGQIATIAAIAGGVAVAAGLSLLAWGGSNGEHEPAGSSTAERAQGVRLIPLASAARAGLVMQGRF